MEDHEKYDPVTIIYPQILNPFKYAKILIQLGYEPLEPCHGHNLFSLVNMSQKILRYPSIFHYVYHLIQKRGVYHVLFTGFFARVTYDTLKHANEQILRKHICKNGYDEIEDAVEEKEWKEFFSDFSLILLMKSYEVVITFPFRVVLTRQMADFIVDKDSSLWFHQAFMIIYRTSGFGGFYKGFIPALLYEIFKSSAYYITCRLIYWALKESSDNNYTNAPATMRSKPVRLIPRSILTFFCLNFFYSYELVSTVMILDCVPLGPSKLELSSYGSWRKCWRHMNVTGQLKRGYSTIFRNHVQDKHR